MPDRRCLLTVHAHPDDESSKGASTVARYHATGVYTVLVSCTGGEEGSILNPEMDLPEIRARIREIRSEELDNAVAIIGYDEVDRLGYRDSGMPGSDANERSDSFARAPLEEAVGRLVEVIRRVRPQVVVTYPDEQSEYPHPDHLRVHEVSIEAFDAAADRARFPGAGSPYAPAKLYYTLWPASMMRAAHDAYLELGLESPYSERWLERVDRMAAAEQVTTRIDVSGFEDVRRRALRSHATQMDPTSPFWFGLPAEVRRSLQAEDRYFLARSRVGSIEGPEDDLFASVP